MLKPTLIALSFLLPLSAQADLSTDIHALQTRWARIQYEQAEDKREAALEALSKEAAHLTNLYSQQAEPLIWEAIIVSTYAGAKGGFGALSLVEKARDLLLKAEKIEPMALKGSIYTSLGSLYYQVPGWPLGFGDNDKAKEYLQKALKINPKGIDPNYFYGDYLLTEEEDYAGAIEAFEKALQAPPRKDRPMADEGRKQEIKKALKATREYLE